MHYKDLATTEAQALAIYAQNGFYSVDKTEEDVSVDTEQPEEFRHCQSTTILSLIKENPKDIEGQSIQMTTPKKDVVKDFMRGRTIMTLKTTSLIILAINIKASSRDTSTSPASIFIKCLRWYTYAVICVFASIGLGCWLKQLRNLSAKTWINNVPIRANIVAQTAGLLLIGVSAIAENIVTGVFLGLYAVVVLAWWSV